MRCAAAHAQLQNPSRFQLHDDELSLAAHFPNVLITAHQAFLTREALSEIARVPTANILQLGTGEQFLAGTTL